MGLPLQVGQLRVRGAGSSPATLRPRCEQLLSGIDAPPQLPRTAILLIRRLGEPLPAAVLERGRGTHTWQEHVRSTLAQCHAAAARVRGGELPSDANVVIFADEGEWLACLLLDLARGRVLERWWWRGIRPSIAGTRREAIVRHIMTRPRVSVAAVAQLASWDVLPDVASRLDDEAAHAIVSGVASEHHAPGLRAVADSACDVGGERKSHENSDADGPRVSKRTSPSNDTRARHVQAPAGTFTSPHVPIAPWQPFMSVTGGLTAAQQWCVGSLVVLHVAPARGRSREFAQQCNEWLERAAAPSSTNAPTPHRATREPSVTEAQRHAACAKPNTPAPLPTILDHEQTVTVAQQAADTVIEREVHSTRAATDTRLPANPVETVCGGVLYLINLLTRRDVLAGEDALAGLVLDCDRWHLLRTIGLAMCGEDAEGDPLWPLLAALTAPPEVAALSATKTWVDSVVSCLRSRLAMILDLPEDQVSLELLRRRAVVSVSATHVDAVFSLADVSLRVRRAGLDVDPGWLPEYSRVIRFHYETV